MEFVCSVELWQWKGKGAWCFVTVPLEYSEIIRSTDILPKKGFGSVRVEVHLQDSTWKTSIFPDAKSGCYFLPIKKAVRTKHNLQIGADIELKIKVLGM